MPWSETILMSERLCFIADLERNLYSMTELCERHGISRKTGYKWAERYVAEGVEGLKDRSRAPKRCRHRTEDRVVEALVAARASTLAGGLGNCWRTYESDSRIGHGRLPARQGPSSSGMAWWSRAGVAGLAVGWDALRSM